MLCLLTQHKTFTFLRHPEMYVAKILFFFVGQLHWVPKWPKLFGKSVEICLQHSSNWFCLRVHVLWQFFRCTAMTTLNSLTWKCDIVKHANGSVRPDGRGVCTVTCLQNLWNVKILCCSSDVGWHCKNSFRSVWARLPPHLQEHFLSQCLFSPSC